MRKLYDWSAYYMAGEEHMNLPPAPFHAEMCNILETKGRVAIQAPRYFGKSVYASFCLPLWAVLEAGYKDVMIVTATQLKAVDILDKIRNEIAQNKGLRSDYEIRIPKRKEGVGKWSNLEVRFKCINGTKRIRVKGRNFQVRGFHPDFLICDDLEQDKELLKAEQREKLCTWFDRSLMRMMRSDDPVIVVGTVIHPLSLLAKLLKREGWVHKHYKALDRNDESIWPEAFSTESLRLERNLDFYGFMSERQGTPLVSNRTLVMPDWIKINHNIMPEIQETYMAVDPALTDKKTKNGCASGIVVLGIGVDKKIYEVYSTKGYWSATDVLKEIIEVFRNIRPRPAYAGIEAIVFQKVLSQLAAQIAPDINFLEIGHKGRIMGKVERARPTVHLFQRGMVHLKNPELIEQIRSFPDGENDMADACFYALRMIMDYSTIWYEIKKRDEEDDEDYKIREAVLQRIKERHSIKNGENVQDYFLGTDW